jgi:hypothetical protein
MKVAFNVAPCCCCCCCRVVVLEDNDVLHIVGGGYGIYNTRQADVETAVPRRLQVLQLEVDQIMKVCRMVSALDKLCSMRVVTTLCVAVGWLRALHAD